MCPILFQIGIFNIYSYGLMIAVSFIVASNLIYKEAKRKNFYPEVLYNLSFIILIAGVIGSRLLYVSINFRDFIDKPLDVFMLNKGGLAVFGGIIVASLSSVVFLKIKKIPILKALDLVVPFMALGQAIGRIGCLLNGCCYGRASSFGIYFPIHNEVLLPTQIYSSIALILIYIFLRKFQWYNKIDGVVFFLYILLYSIKRFFIEFLRGDTILVFDGITLFQSFCLLLSLVSIFAILILRKNKLNAKI